MRRLPLIDAILISVLVPLWLVVLAIHVREVASGGLAWVGVYIEAPDQLDGYPSVQSFWPELAAADSGFVPGDRLVKLGETELSGVGPVRFFALAQEAAARDRQSGGRLLATRVTYLRSGEQRVAPLPFVPIRLPWRLLPLIVGLVTAGTLVLLRRPDLRVSRVFFLGTMAFSLHLTWFFGGNRFVTYAWIVVFAVAATVMFPLILLEMSMFPEEIAPASALPRWPWAFATNGPIALTAVLGTPLPPAVGLPGMYIVNIGVISALLWVLTRNYLRAGPLGRRQLKWKMYGFYIGLAPVMASDLITLAVPIWWWLHDVAVIAEVAIPICLFVAITRFRLYDIDRLITATAVYTVLSVILLVGVLVVVPPLTRAASALTDIDPAIGTVLFSAIIAVSLIPLQRSLSPFLEGMLFRERHALQEGVTRLFPMITAAVDRNALLDLVGAQLVELFRPASCFVWRRAGDLYVASFTTPASDGIMRAPSFRSAGEFVESIRTARAPLQPESARGRRTATVKLTTDLDERAAVEKIAPAVLVPVSTGDELVAIISLGGKQSGDVYSPGDLALLAAVADKVSSEIARLEQLRRTASGPVLLPRKYELLSRLGQGGMGVVFKVRHVELGTVLALKILPDHLASSAQLVRRFHQEARVMARLQHPNIVRVLDVDVEGTLHYFVMEYVAGQTLAQIVQRLGPRPLPEVIAIARQIGAALDYAHTRIPVVVHRDVTPSNVIIEDMTRRVVVTDFGIAKVMETGETALTHTGDFLGKRRYCAPEHLRGDREVDARADIYSLGMVMYETFAGRQFFAGLEDFEVTRRVLSDPCENVPDFGRQAPEQFRAVVTRAIAKDRNRRYQSVAELILDLDRLSESVVPAPQDLPWPDDRAGWEAETERAGAAADPTLQKKD